MKKILLIGSTGSGKTTLAQTLNSSIQKYKKTQTIECLNSVFDTPGEYIENRRFFNALLTTSFSCEIIGLIQDCSSSFCIFPPGFATMFNRPVIGIISKIDKEEKKIAFAEKCLINSGVNKVFLVSSIDRFGVEELKKFLTEESDKNSSAL